MERFLTLNIGASRLALAEFGARPGQAPILLRYTFGELPEGAADQPETFGVEIEGAMRTMMAEAGIKPARILVSLSGQMAFPRFVKVLAESPEKIREQIKFEVEQNVPFPLSEAIWSDALVGQPDLGEQHVMIVAARADLVGAVTHGLINAGCEPEVVDVAPVALYNAARYNYPEADGCTLIVDMGARCTNLVFVEQDRIFYRTIPVAGNTITAEIAKNFACSLEEAEAFKCESGVVAQGGAFQIDDPSIDKLSKVIRTVMTRLNAEISRSISFYRSQQEGSAPDRVLLTGGTAQMAYMQNFFEEKLQVEVDFLNPFTTVAYEEPEDAEKFSQDAFSMPVLVGLALRRGLTCPVEVNLVSQELVDRKAFRKRIPFLVTAAAGLIIIMGIWLAYINNMRGLYQQQYDGNQARLDDYNTLNARYEAVDKKAKDAETRAAAYQKLLASRLEWMNMLTAVDKAIPDGLWVTKLNAARTEGRVSSLNLSIATWQDLEAKICLPGKTIDETVVAHLAEQPVFGQEGKVSTKNQSEPWTTTFNLNVGLKAAAEAAAAAKPATNRRRR